MLTLFLEDSGLLREDARILSVGAGHETVAVLAREPGRQGRRDRHLRRGKLQRAARRIERCSPTLLRSRPTPTASRTSRCGTWTPSSSSSRTTRSTRSSRCRRSSTSDRGRTSGALPRRSGRVSGPGGVAYIATECFLGRSLLSPRASRRRAAETGGRMFGDARLHAETLVSEIVEPSGLELVQPTRRDASRDRSRT